MYKNHHNGNYLERLVSVFYMHIFSVFTESVPLIFAFASNNFETISVRSKHDCLQLNYVSVICKIQYRQYLLAMM